LPLVWPGGTYNNNGVTQGSIHNCFSDAGFNPNPVLPVKLLHFLQQFLVQVLEVEEGILICLQKTSNYHKFKASIAVDQNCR
jgi:hypothetical protein